MLVFSLAPLVCAQANVGSGKPHSRHLCSHNRWPLVVRPRPRTPSLTQNTRRPTRTIVHNESAVRLFFLWVTGPRVTGTEMRPPSLQARHDDLRLLRSERMKRPGRVRGLACLVQPTRLVLRHTEWIGRTMIQRWQRQRPPQACKQGFWARHFFPRPRRRDVRADARPHAPSPTWTRLLAHASNHRPLGSNHRPLGRRRRGA